MNDIKKKKIIIPYSKLRETHRSNLEEILPLKMPLTIFIEPVNICNFKCVQCFQSFSDYKESNEFSGFMDLVLYEKIVNEIKYMGKLKSLKLYIRGESLLHKDIAQMVKMANELDISERIELTTNASLLNEKISTELIEAGLNYLRISVYSIYLDRHAHVTNSKYTPEDIYNNVKIFKTIRDKLNKNNPFIQVKILNTFSEENEEFKNLYKNIADEVFIEEPMNWNNFENRDSIEKLYSDKAIDRDKLFPHIKKICPIPFYSLCITANGDVLACCVDWNCKTKIGNIKEETLTEIWFGEKLKAFRKLHIEGKRFKNASCKNCTFLYTNPDNIDNISSKNYNEILNYKK